MNDFVKSSPNYEKMNDLLDTQNDLKKWHNDIKIQESLLPEKLKASGVSNESLLLKNLEV